MEFEELGLGCLLPGATSIWDTVVNIFTDLASGGEMQTRLSEREKAL